MSDHIPFEIQSEIMKMLPVKSLIQFRSVSKQWMSFIDNPEFIKNYHINHTNPQHHLLVSYKSADITTYTSIIDNNTFPQQKFPLTAPESLSLLGDAFIIGSVDGLLCFYCYVGGSNSKNMVVIWNPTVRKSVAVDIPYHKPGSYTVVGFGVCPDPSVPKLLKIIVDKRLGSWIVEVFTLSTRVWKTVYTGVPFKSCDLVWFQVCVDGVIYFRAVDDKFLNRRSKLNFVISFNLKTEKFSDVCLPDKLVHTPYHLGVAKVNESLGLLEFCDEGDMTVCSVWTRKDGAEKMFSKIYTVKVEGKSLFTVLGFRNNGEVVIKVVDDNHDECRIKAYEPLSGHINDVGINGNRHGFNARSYMETLLLLDESD